MSLLKLAFAYLWHRPLATLINGTAIAAGVAAILIVLGLKESVERTLMRPATSYDLVVGAPGSDVSLVLAALFHLDQPPGNFSYASFQRLGELDGVQAAYPLAMGDYYRGVPIVGTSLARLRQFIPLAAESKDEPPLAAGKLFAKDFEVVAGAQVARRLDLQVGQTFFGSHGAAGGFNEHRQHPFTVVGILPPTGGELDETLWTTLGSYWKIHTPVLGDDAAENAEINRFAATGPEVTLALLRVSRSKLLITQRSIKQLGLNAVRPAEVLERLFDQLLTPLEQILLVYGYGIAVVASLSMLATLYLAMLVRRRELAILRAIGARPGEIFRLVLYEAALLLIVGSGMGILGSWLLTRGITYQVGSKLGITLVTTTSSPMQLSALALVFVTGLAAALLPAFSAYRTEIARDLRRR